jgi:nucleoside-diphosphate-sugar epimerase
MPTKAPERILVTGCAGFIGSHVCPALVAMGYEVIGLDIARPASNAYEFLCADIRDPKSLRQAAKRAAADAVIHLAAVAEVITPFEEFGELLATNVAGTLNVLEAFQPKLFVFPSTSAVYGNSRKDGARPVWEEIHPIGIYGMSKANGEMICQAWSRTRGGVAVNLRLGNVVGARCRGLIPFLVCHAKKYPKGVPVAPLRGKGRLVRDYVPIEHTVEVMLAALGHEWASGSCQTFNVGTGWRISNRYVVGVAKQVLRSRGYDLNPDFRNPVAPGEVQEVVFDVRSTAREFGLARPARSSVAKSIREATLSYVD